jgi:hypothetical protein
MSQPLQYAFLDESGTVSPFSGSHFLIVALVSTLHSRPLELHVRRAHKKYGTSLRSGEMKADGSREAVIEELLNAIAQEPVAIVTVAVDKQVIIRPPRDLEDIYRRAVSLALGHLVRQWPRVDICLDKRYTTERLRYRLERELREAIADLPHEVVIIRQEDSISRKELQAADYVAWAIYQKYERGDSRFYDLIADRLIVEEVIEQALW